jgi:hypothetical protein
MVVHAWSSDLTKEDHATIDFVLVQCDVQIELSREKAERESTSIGTADPHNLNPTAQTGFVDP